MDIQTLRSYRLFGIAMFDLVASFLGAFIIDYFILKVKNKSAFYLSVIPIGVIVHLLTSQNTFLNSQILSKDINGYQVVFSINIVLLVYIYILSK